jgi:hypothetical protein
MKKVFYEKVGGRYKPVREYDSDLMDAMPKGTHIIMSYPGGRSTRYNIDPALAPMIAAGRVAEDAISASIMEASALRPRQDRKLTEEQLKAWEHLSDLLGHERYALEYASYREAAEAGVKAMMDEANKLLENPAVKKAYEHFLLVAELTKEQNEPQS